MTTLKWHEQPLVALDTETTGINPAEARIVTAALVHMTPGQRPIAHRYLIDPGIDIPTEAAAVHGYTNDRILELVGRPGHAVRSIGPARPVVISRDQALFEIAAQVAATIGREHALVVHNAAYDLTLLEHETARNGVPTLSERPMGVRGVVDPMVLEKAYDPFRRMYKETGGCRGGKVKCGGCGATDKTLTSLCAHYGVRHAGAHDAADDAIASVRLLHKLVAAWPEMARWKLSTLHENQVGWRREQMDSLRAYFDKNGVEHDGCDGSWPLQSSALQGVAA